MNSLSPWPPPSPLASVRLFWLNICKSAMRHGGTVMLIANLNLRLKFATLSTLLDNGLVVVTGLGTGQLILQCTYDVVTDILRTVMLVGVGRLFIYLVRAWERIGYCRRTIFMMLLFLFNWFSVELLSSELPLAASQQVRVMHSALVQQVGVVHSALLSTTFSWAVHILQFVLKSRYSYWVL